jgi:hypothetical protein
VNFLPCAKSSGKEILGIYPSINANQSLHHDDGTGRAAINITELWNYAEKTIRIICGLPSVIT